MHSANPQHPFADVSRVKLCAGGREMSGRVVDRDHVGRVRFDFWWMDVRLDSGERIYLISRDRWWYRSTEGGRPISPLERVEVFRAAEQHLAD